MLRVLFSSSMTRRMRREESCSRMAARLAALRSQKESSDRGPAQPPPSFSSASGSARSTPLICRVQVTTAASMMWISSRSCCSAAAAAVAAAEAPALATELTEKEAGRRVEPSEERLRGGSSGGRVTGGTGRIVCPLVRPTVAQAEAENLCMLSTTSRVTTSGQPTWFLELQRRGTKTSAAAAYSCSSTASDTSPCSSRFSNSSAGTGPGCSFRK